MNQKRICDRLSWIEQATKDIEKTYNTVFEPNTDFGEILECINEIREELEG